MNKKKTVILVSTDSAKIHTGLAETTRLLFTELLKKYPDKYDIHQLGWFNFNPIEEVPWPVYSTNVKQEGNRKVPDMSDKYGQRTFESVRQKVKPDIVYSNGDLWCFDHLLTSPTRNEYRLVVYYTIDGSPYFGSSRTDTASEWGSKLYKADRIAVLTDWGVDVLHGSCPEIKDRHIDVISHPADVERFTPRTREEKIELRHKIYNPQIPKDAFILGWVGRNQYRKQNYKMWEILHYMMYGDYIRCNDCGRVTVMEYDPATRAPRKTGSLMTYDADYDYKECWHCKSKNIENGQPKNDFYLWLHMNKQDPGWKPDLLSYLWRVESNISFTTGLKASKGLSPNILADLISSWDGMLYLTGGEGFGIPALEAMESGVPLIYTNYSSHADFAKHGGLPVRSTFIPEFNFLIHRAVAENNHAVEQALWAYEHRDEFAALGSQGRAYTETITTPVIAEQWDKVFTEMMEQPLPIHNTETIYCQTV
jgi:glycosyltransferase involved in cell wall biosynthesis